MSFSSSGSTDCGGWEAEFWASAAEKDRSRIVIASASLFMAQHDNPTPGTQAFGLPPQAAREELKGSLAASEELRKRAKSPTEVRYPSHLATGVLSAR